MDCFLAARRVGRAGSVVGIDMTEAMLDRARTGSAEAELSHVRFEKADMTNLPLESSTIDVVISNGVFNLAPDKEALFNELYRVAKPGGRLQFADITVGVELSETVRNNIDLWTG
jgi:ubiquinone/menaquinone biosynthesis C-methylase UbiE